MIIRRSFVSLFSALIVFSALFLFSDSARSASFEEEATLFVEEMADKAIKKLTDKTAPQDERIERFRTYLNTHFDVESIGEWILGRYWNKATEMEQKEYLNLFEDLIVVSYVDRFASYAGEPLHILKSHAQDEKHVTVFSEIHQKDGKPAVRVNWKVEREDDLIQIIDVVVEGISLRKTLRSDFRSIIRSRHRSISGLLDALREKTAKLRKQTPN